jgi:hypothetical protein
METAMWRSDYNRQHSALFHQRMREQDWHTVEEGLGRAFALLKRAVISPTVG